MSVNIKQLDGTLKKVAGNTILLDGTCSEIQSGTITIPANTTEGNWHTTVTMPTTMTDTDYIVILNVLPVDGILYTSNANSGAKTTTSFIVNCVTGNIPLAQTIEWYAFRLVELEGYNTIYNKMTNIDSAPTENSTNLVTSGGVYDAISSASKIFINSESAWNELDAETKATYQVAIFTDKPNVNAVDSTDGSTTVVANKNLVFKGALNEWNNLTVAQKKAYDEALITNDMDTGEVVDAVTDGDMRAVTSNAVANLLAFEDVSFSVNIAAQGRNYVYVNIPSKSGYTAKLVSLKDLVAPTDLAGIMVYSCLNPSTGKCLVVIHNDITSSQTVTGIVTVMYVKN